VIRARCLKPRTKGKIKKPGGLSNSLVLNDRIAETGRHERTMVFGERCALSSERGEKRTLLDFAHLTRAPDGRESRR
jgi:hypothetical protein